MIVFFYRDFVDIFFRRERFFSFFCCTKIALHLRLIHIFLQTEIDERLFLLIRIEQIIAFILCVRHTKFFVDIFRQRMYLQGKILASHSIEQVKPDRKLCAEPAVHTLTEQLMRCIQNKILRRNLQHFSADFQIQTVLLRDTVKAPGEVFLRSIKTEVFFHPLTAPHARIKVRLHTKWFSGKLGKRTSEGISGCENRHIFFLCIKKIRKSLISFFFITVCQTPFDEKASLIFGKNRIITVGTVPVRHSRTVTKLYLPAGQIAVNQKICFCEQLCRGSDENHKTALHCFDFSFGFFQFFFFKPGIDRFVAHNAKNTVVRNIILKFLPERLLIFGTFLSVKDAIRLQCFCQPENFFFPYAGIQIKCQNTFFLLLLLFPDCTFQFFDDLCFFIPNFFFISVNFHLRM